MLLPTFDWLAHSITNMSSYYRKTVLYFNRFNAGYYSPTRRLGMCHLFGQQSLYPSNLFYLLSQIADLTAAQHPELNLSSQLRLFRIGSEDGLDGELLWYCTPQQSINLQPLRFSVRFCSLSFICILFWLCAAVFRVVAFCNWVFCACANRLNLGRAFFFVGQKHFGQTFRPCSSLFMPLYCLDYYYCWEKNAVFIRYWFGCCL